MKNRLSLVIEWSIAIILMVLCFNISFLSYGNFSPVAAHQQSERTYYYGPSQIMDTIHLENAKIYLCRYKSWYSASIVKRDLLLWRTSGLNIGSKIDVSKPINYSWGYTRINKKLNVNKIFGIVNDSAITKVVLFSEDGQTHLEYELDKAKMFIFHWSGEDKLRQYKYLRGLDSTGNILYEITIYH